MKALKSELAKRVLADPKASKQLRRFLASKMLESGVIDGGIRGDKAASHSGTADIGATDIGKTKAPASTAADRRSGSSVIEIRTDEGGTLRFQPVIVPNA